MRAYWGLLTFLLLCLTPVLSPASVLLPGERLPVALEDGRLRWAEGRYVDPEGSITDYWVSPQAIFFTVQTPTATFLKRLEPAAGKLEVLLTLPPHGVVRFHPVAAYALIPTAATSVTPAVWQLLELPYHTPTPRLICADPVAPSLSGYLNTILIRRGTQLWSLLPTGPMTLLDSDVTEWLPGRDLFANPDVWVYKSWAFRTVPPLMPSGFYRRASGQYYLLDQQLQPTPILFPVGTTPLWLSPDAVIATQYIPLVRTIDQTRHIEFWSLQTHRIVPLTSFSVRDLTLDPTDTTLVWGQTPQGPVAVYAHDNRIEELLLETGDKRTRVSRDTPIQDLAVRLHDNRLWVQPNNGPWYAVGATAILPPDTDMLASLPTTLQAPIGVSSPLLPAAPAPVIPPAKPSASIPAPPIAAIPSPASSVPVPTQTPERTQALVPPGTDRTAPMLPVGRPSSTPPLTTLPSVKPVLPVSPPIPTAPGPAVPPSAHPVEPNPTSHPLSAPRLPAPSSPALCFTLPSAGTLRAFPDTAAPSLGTVPPRAIYHQSRTTTRASHLWYQLTLSPTAHDPITGWVAGSEITPLGPCQASEPSSTTSAVLP